MVYRERLPERTLSSKRKGGRGLMVGWIGDKSQGTRQKKRCPMAPSRSLSCFPSGSTRVSSRNSRFRLFGFAWMLSGRRTTKARESLLHNHVIHRCCRCFLPTAGWGLWVCKRFSPKRLENMVATEVFRTSFLLL